MKIVPETRPVFDSPYFDENAEQFLPCLAASPRTGTALTEQIRLRAFELGFAKAGFARAEPFLEAGAAFERWLGKGYAGTMQYLGELGDRADPRRMLPNARTVVVVAMPTTGPIHGEPSPSQGTVADYALGLDYHIAIRGRMQRLCEAMADYSGQPHWARPCIDSAPLLEREAARRAGVGFIGKSTMLIVPGLGPRVLLGVVVTTLELVEDEPMKTRCGSCTACLEACPSHAFVGPFELDARRCISYLTIEHQGRVPDELRTAMGNCLVGCDACQTACPYDRVGAALVMPSDNAPRLWLVHPELCRWLEMSSNDYRRITKRTALRRLGRVQLMRNAAIGLGNARSLATVSTLARVLVQAKSPVVRAHVAWALGQIGGDEAKAALRDATVTEEDCWVREELEHSLLGQKT